MKARRSPFFALALLVPLLALAAGAGIVIGFSLEGGAIPAIAALVPLAAAIGAIALRRQVGPAAAIVGAFAALGYGGPLWIASTSILDAPIVASGWRCGTAEVTAGMFLAIASVVSSLGTGTLGAFVARAATRRRTELALRVIAATAIAALLALTAVLATHGPRESRSSFLASLTVTELPRVTTPMATADAWDTAPTEIAGATFIVQHRIGEGVTTTELEPARGVGRSCALLVIRGAREERHSIAYLYDKGEVRERCPDLRVRYVPSFRGHDAFVVERAFSDASTAYYPQTVIDGSTLESTSLAAHDVPTVGPPSSWLFGVMLAGAIALLFFVASARARPSEELGLEGEHTGKGWVRFTSSAPRFVPALVGTEAGPVVFRGAVEATSYRDDGGASHGSPVALGTRETLRAEAHQARAAYSCLAIAAAILALAPLVSAAIYGVL